MSRHVVICIPCLLVGGTEMHTLALVKALLGGGYSVTVCVYYEHDPVMVREVEQAGARVRLLGLERTTGKRDLARMPQLAAALVRLFRSERPHFVHVQYMAPGALPILVAKLCCAPRVFATVHVPGHACGRAIWMARTAARLCDVFLCVSEVAENSFFGSSALFDEELFRKGRRHFTIHNPVDLQEVDQVVASGRASVKRTELCLHGRPVIGVVGRLRQEKGQRWLLDAMREVVRRVPGAKLVVVGDGPDGPMLRAHARDIGLDENVLWIGKVPHEDALMFYGAMDVVAVPSMWEGFGLSAAEAMAFGRPVVASDVDGLREVVEDKVTGMLVPCGDTTGMADAIAHVLLNSEERARMGAKGRQRAECLFSRDVFTERHLRLYRARGPGSPRDSKNRTPGLPSRPVINRTTAVVSPTGGRAAWG